jgi:hypothetical protein
MLVACAGLLLAGAAMAQDDLNPPAKAEDLLRVVRNDWQRVENWFERSPERFRDWMALLQRAALLAQWQKAPAIEPAVVRDLEFNFKRYIDYINDPRYTQFVASYSEWQKAAVRESIQRMASDIRRQAASTPTASSTPSFYRQRIGTALREVQVALIPFTRQGAKDWRRFLRWDTLEQLSTGNDPLPLETLQEQQVILRNGYVVWDVEAMRNLQLAIDAAAIQAAVDAEPDYAAARREQFLQLADAVAAFAKSPTNENRLAIGPPLFWLRTHGELRTIAPNLVPLVSIPNFRYETNAQVIERDVNQHLDETLDVNDYYNGTSVVGRAKFSANLKAQLMPSTRRALWALRMDGSTVSNNSASGQGVRLNTTGNTKVSATKTIAMDASGMKSQPAVASADSSIDYSNVDASSWGGYQNEALNRVYGSQGSAERQAEQRTESYIMQRLDRDGSRYVSDYNVKYQENFVYPRARQLAWPHQFQTWSTSEQIVMDLLDGPLDSLGASSPAPASPFEADAFVKSHVTAFDAYGWRKLAGKKLTVTELRQILVDLGMQEDAAKPEPGAEEVSAAVAAERAARTLSFPKLKPIEFTLGNGLLTGVSHLEGFSAEGQDYDPMTVKFSYRLSKVENGVEIKRESLQAWPASFDPGSGQRLSGPQLVVRKLLVNVLSDALPERSVITHVSGGLGDAMPIKQFANLGEWLILGMSIPQPAESESKPVARVPTPRK